jgi:hypothetical protein
VTVSVFRGLHVEVCLACLRVAASAKAGHAGVSVKNKFSSFL